jgi:hypothetical protein
MVHISSFLLPLASAGYAAAQLVQGYDAPTAAQQAATANYAIYGQVVDATNDTATNHASAPVQNGVKATVKVLCSYIGNPPITDSAIVVHGFGTYNSYCRTNATVDFKGFFFLNHTVNTNAATLNNSAVHTNEYDLANHCNGPIPLSPQDLASLWSVVNDTKQVNGTGCLASNGFAFNANNVTGPSKIAGSPAATGASASGSASQSAAANNAGSIYAAGMTVGMVAMGAAWALL